MQKKLYELKENPLSTAIYGESEDVSDLAENMKQVGQITPIVIKPDGTIISGHRRYRAARQAGMILVNVEVKTPKDKGEEELWIISANKQREKTPDQLYREGKRLEAIFSAMGRERKSEGRAMAWQEHRQQSKTKVDLAETAKTTNEPTAQGSDSTLDIEATYNKAIERSEQSQHMEAESQPIAEHTQLNSAQTHPKAKPIRTRELVAKELNISPATYRQIKTVGDAAEAGVPEAQEAMRQLARKEITVNKANTMVLQALHPELPIVKTKPKPDRKERLLADYEDAKQWVFGVIDDIKRESPETSLADAKHIIVATSDHIKLLNIMKEKLFIYIEDKEEEEQYAKG